MRQRREGLHVEPAAQPERHIAGRESVGCRAAAIQDLRRGERRAAAARAYHIRLLPPRGPYSTLRHFETPSERSRSPHSHTHTHNHKPTGARQLRVGACPAPSTRRKSERTTGCGPRSSRCLPIRRIAARTPERHAPHVLDSARSVTAWATEVAQAQACPSVRDSRRARARRRPRSCVTSRGCLLQRTGRGRGRGATAPTNTGSITARRACQCIAG